MTNIEIIKYKNKEIIEKNTLNNLDEKIEQNRGFLSRLCDFLSLFMPNNNIDLLDVIEDLEKYDTIKIEMYKD